MGHKRSCRCAARIGNEHRSFHLHEITAVKETTNFLNDCGSLLEGLADILIHDEIHISLAIADIGILQSVELLRKRLQRLGKKDQFLRMDRNLSGLCAEREALDADDVTDVQALECCIGVISQVIAGDINLNSAVAVLKIGKGCLSHYALEQHAACDRNLCGFLHIISFLIQLTCELIEMIQNFLRMMSLIIFCNLKRILAFCLQLCQLFSSYLFQLTDVLLGRILVVLILCHIYTSLRQNPQRRFCRMRQPVRQHQCCSCSYLKKSANQSSLGAMERIL